MSPASRNATAEYLEAVTSILELGMAYYELSVFRVRGFGGMTCTVSCLEFRFTGPFFTALASCVIRMSMDMTLLY